MPRRSSLSRARILAAALELADAGGIEAVSMRRLGEALGFEAMSLYTHVAGKDDVLDGILDLVLAETEAPAPGGDWADEIRRSAISVHRALGRHPWAATLLMTSPRVLSARLRYMDALLGSLREAGFSADATFHAYHVLDAHIFGFAVWQASHTYTPEEAARLADAFERAITPQEYPYLHEHARQHFEGGPDDEVSAFELGLDLILAGLAVSRVSRTP
jgi:AcrR family transcriptional regulator